MTNSNNNEQPTDDALPEINLDHERKIIVGRKLSEFLVAMRSNQEMDVFASFEALAHDIGRIQPENADEDRFYWNMNKISDLALAYIEERRANKGLPGVTTGFSRLDEGIGGLEPENIYTLNATPGAGKTQTALQIAWEASNFTNVIYFSPEARARMMSRRLISLLAEIPGWMIRRGDINDHQMETLRKASKVMRSRPLHFYDLPELSISHMNRILDRVYRETGTVPGLVVLDYLQQMQGEDSFQTITNNMKSLETFTVKNNVALLMMSQVGRASGDGSSLASAKGSGKIEELSSVVMGLSKLEQKGDDSADPNDKYRRWLTISKNREEGETFRIGLEFDRTSGRLREARFGD